MLADLRLDKVRTLLGRLGVALLHVELTGVHVLHLPRPQDIVENEVNFELLEVTQLFLAHIRMVEDLINLVR